MKGIEPKPPDSFGFEEILYRKEGSVATVTINRPQNYNAYNTPALKELATAFNDAALDDAIGVIVLTGAGDKAFSTGGDVKEYEDHYTKRPRDYFKYMGLFKAYIESILYSGKPTIARINGMAVGGGNESQMACDLAVIGEHTFVGQVGTSVGSVACGGATQWLPILVGERRAKEMLLLNPRIPARQALDWGLVNRVAPTVKKNGQTVGNPSPDEIAKANQGKDGYSVDLSVLDAEVKALADELLRKFPECTRYTRTQTGFWKDLSWHNTVGHARDWLALHFTSAEVHEGMGAFVEKRKTDYAGLRRKAAEGGSSEYVWGPYAKTCPACGAKRIPSEFEFCGKCGGKL